MLFQVMLAVYAAAAGFVAAGLLGSFYQLLTNEPPHFMMRADGWIASLIGVLVCIFAGPFIIMRHAIRGRRLEGRPLGWLAASAAIAAGWSLCSGIIVIEFVLVVRDSVA